eukprot:TRINITY_DN1102_c0_g1_i1.p1 TRINITY_DN1102_c0_g1~~TRINITY_DN1102_c0_g1_i1.p1  ORF type:complete len:373 (-),score=110.84 TRINITY_DN1102_c0_g1_i1:208-1326(-)
MEPTKNTNQFKNEMTSTNKAQSIPSFTLDDLRVSMNDKDYAVKMLDILDTFGCVQVMDVLSEQEVDEYADRFLQDLEDTTLGFKKDDPETFKKENLPKGPKLGVFHHGIRGFKSYVDLTVEERLFDPFKEFFGTDELRVSMDSAVYMKSVEKLSQPTWPHLDQSFCRSEEDVYGCIQGSFALSTSVQDQSDAAYGTRCYVGSHKVFSEILEEMGDEVIKGSNWVPLWNKEDWIKEKVEGIGGVASFVLPQVKGALTLWLSSTIHDGKAPVHAAGEEVIERMVMFVTFRPTSDEAKHGLVMTDEDCAVLDKCRDENLSANHWGQKIFGAAKSVDLGTGGKQELYARPELLPNWCGKEYYQGLGSHGKKIYGLE